ncbi:DUF4159 domain-containing protein [Oceanibacterium hippocampi]|uniref:Aerotolerance regulator N-terminal domain-containing protein n=1 Tax=Oceanibacterium hippocampi TaxID=745714 RepID=A0A1Y5S8B9_9PROT|nr:DUF4159 domain-containing protein [Oceanibacterium hippocampi]SLN34757.1 hypothetical protein OCH7691_01360 [Oceanibacterium hippocampi]
MLTLGPVAFAAPWLLIALAALPLLWWLLRVTPPAPRVVAFPPIRFLFDLRNREETPVHTPWWLLLLRLLIAAFVILAVARPLLNPGAVTDGSGPLLIVLDDGWAGAGNWQSRREVMADLLTAAERGRRPVAILKTAPTAPDGEIAEVRLMSAGEARAVAGAAEPRPWPVDRGRAIEALDAFEAGGGAEVVWLADGVAGDAAGDVAFARALADRGRLTVYGDPDHPVMMLDRPEIVGTELRIEAQRSEGAAPAADWLKASAEGGLVLARVPLSFAAGERTAGAVVALPTELRNRLLRLEIEGAGNAAAVMLFDERWRRRPVGLVSGGGLETAQPLLSDIYYLERALEPFAEVRKGSIAELIDQGIAVLVLADVGNVVGSEREALDGWLNAGGVLIRFAGDKMAAQSDDLVPVRLRVGGRDLGGAMSWSEPARLAPFADESPFFGLEMAPDVRVRRQVLAEPEIELKRKTWAALLDGTPLVTADRHGDGRIVLFHTTANTDWSNLPLSGLFVTMLQRLVALSRGVAADEGREPLPPFAMLDGYGRLVPPQSNVARAAPAGFDEIVPGPTHPPGFYGTAESKRALNLSGKLGTLEPLGPPPAGTAERVYAAEQERDLMPWLLTLAVLLLFVDFLVSMQLRGLLRLAGRGAAPLALAFALAAGLSADPARAQTTNDADALAATLETRLAYVLSGERAVDEMSHAGLYGLGRVLSERTSVEPAAPAGIDIERDEIVFYPLLYWPVVQDQPLLSAAALARVDAYMKHGGTILFDTREGGGFETGANGARLRQLLRLLDIPPLAPVPENHVLTKAFYLMHEFPGRFPGGTLWVEADASGTHDGVSAIVIGANDWAAAWATDEDGRPLAALVPNNPRQREMAYRFGVNLVMYTLTGNYKADQVHVPAILERLGQ